MFLNYQTSYMHTIFQKLLSFVHLQWRLDQFVNSWIGSVNNLPYCLIFKVSIKNQSMHEIEKKIMVSFPVEVHFKQKQYRLLNSLTLSSLNHSS